MRSEDKRVPAEYDNFYQLKRPNRPTRFTTDRFAGPHRHKLVDAGVPHAHSEEAVPHVAGGVSFVEL